MRNRFWLVALLLLSGSCVHERRPNIYYLCEATLTTENGAFRASPDAVEWQYDLGDGMRAGVLELHAWQSAESFRAGGFDNVLDFPGLVIRFDHRFNRNDWMQTPPRLSVAAQISVGVHAQTRWVSNLDSVVFMHSAWNGLLAEEGDMDVTLYEAESRAVLQRATIPRHALESIEPTLQRLSVELAEMERDPQNRCTAVEEEEITVT